MTDEFKRLGLTVKSYPYTLPDDWRPQSWDASYTSSAGAKVEFATIFPVSGTKGTNSEGLTAEAVWLGIGAEPDFIGRKRQGQGGHHLQHIRSRRPQPFGFRPCTPVRRKHAGGKARRRHGD